MIDHSTAQAPIPRQMVPTMGEWQRLRHQQDGRLPLRGTALSWLRHGTRVAVSTLRASIAWRRGR
jgi:hypothetical protein